MTYRWIVAGAALLSIVFCASADYLHRQRLRELNATVLTRRAELRPLGKMYAEVREYQKKKDALQNRIDLINQLKQNQFVPANALTKLSDVKEPVDSAAVLDRETLLINTPNGSRTLR